MCLPGAGFGKVFDSVDTCLENEGITPIVCLSVGGNDIR